MRAHSPSTGFCAGCGLPVERRAPHGPEPSYCSGRCRQRAYKDRYPLGEALLREWGIEPVAVLDLLPEPVSLLDVLRERVLDA